MQGHTHQPSQLHRRRRGARPLAFAGLAWSAAAVAAAATAAMPHPAPRAAAPLGTVTVTAVGSTALQPLCEAAARAVSWPRMPACRSRCRGGGSGPGHHADRPGRRADRQLRRVRRDEARERLRPRQDQGQPRVRRGHGSHCEQRRDHRTTSRSRTSRASSPARSPTGKRWAATTRTSSSSTAASGSGTRATFEAAVLAGEEAPSDFTPQEQDSSGTVTKMVSTTPGAILLRGVLLL